MTYCVGMLLQDGLVMMSDSRTNAGVDHIATHQKLRLWDESDDRLMVLLSAGNLSLTQMVTNLLDEGIAMGGSDTPRTLYDVSSMFQAADMIGEAIRQVYRVHGPSLKEHGEGFNASFILGGQLKGREMRLFNIYAAGNHIAATADTPYFQIGELKYGKPILDRVLHFDTPLMDAVKLGLISMDSTLRSNISVGLPLRLVVIERETLTVRIDRTITEDDPYFNMIREGWSDALRKAYESLPDPDWTNGN